MIVINSEVGILTMILVSISSTSSNVPKDFNLGIRREC